MSGVGQSSRLGTHGRLTRHPTHSSCEFLRKLDLTLNFIDLDTLEGSVAHLVRLPHLRDLFMMGNPAAQVWTNKTRHEDCFGSVGLTAIHTIPTPQRPWWGDDDEEGVDADVRAHAFTYYVAHRLPQLATLDGKELTRSLRLRAARAYPLLEVRDCKESWAFRRVALDIILSWAPIGTPRCAGGRDAGAQGGQGGGAAAVGRA